MQNMQLNQELERVASLQQEIQDLQDTIQAQSNGIASPSKGGKNESLETIMLKLMDLFQDK